MRTVLSQPDKYHVAQGIKLVDAKVGRPDQILTLPLYMGAFLEDV